MDVALDCGGGGNINGMTVFFTNDRMWNNEKVAYGIKVTVLMLVSRGTLNMFSLTRNWLANEEEGSKYQVLDILDIELAKANWTKTNSLRQA